MVQVITQFLKMETLLDDSVKQTIDLQVERGGTSFTVHLVVRRFLYLCLFSLKEFTRTFKKAIPDNNSEQALSMV